MNLTVKLGKNRILLKNYLSYYYNKIIIAGPRRLKLITPDLSDSSSSSSEDEEEQTNITNPEMMEVSGRPSKKSDRIPKFRFGFRTQAEITRLRADCPNLKHHPDETFRSHSLTELIRLDSKLEKTNKAGKNLTEKMAKNLEKSKLSPTEVVSGWDNRADMLHEARFLPGHTCKNAEIWLQARSSIGLTGYDPVSRYDIESVGMAGKINSYVWAALHNPGCKEISIRMLAPEALKAARGMEDRDQVHPKKDFENVKEIRLALATMRTAVQFIAPWNFSFTTLEYFLNSVNFGDSEIFSKHARISYLSEFIDEVILFNAEAWDDEKPFMQAQAISNKWVSEMLLKFPRGTSKSEKPEEGSKGSKPQKRGDQTQKFQFKPGFSRFFIPPGVCRRFNMLSCPKQADDSCQAPWDSSKTLQHVCSYQNPTTKIFCLQKHAMPEHK